MKRFLVLSCAVLALAGCAPLVARVSGDTKNTLTTSSNTLTFSNLDEGEARAGVVAVVGVTKIGGEGARCTFTAPTSAFCELPTVKSASAFKLSFEGKLQGANVTWRTEAGGMRGALLTR